MFVIRHKYLPYAELLGIDNMREVLDVFWDYRMKWKMIGMELGIDMDTLDSISVSNRNAEDSLVELIGVWLRRSNPVPTRTVMDAVLQSSRVVHVADEAPGE